MGLERFADKEILIVGGNESICVPCAVIGKNKKGFMQIVSDKLNESGYKNEVIDFSSMFINKTWHFDEILKHNLTIEEIKNMRKACIRMHRENILGRLYVSKSLEDLDVIKPTDKDRRIVDTIKSYDNVIFFYQTGANDMQYELQANPLNSVVNKQMRARGLRIISDGRTIDAISSRMEKNIDNILSTNNNMELYILGLYSPALYNTLLKNSDDFKRVSQFIEQFNDVAQNFAKSYNAQYIDISSVGKYCAKFGLDQHCTRKGHEVLADLAINSIINNKKKTNTSNNSLTTDNKGLDGMIEEASIRAEKYSNAQMTKDYGNTTLEKFNDDEQDVLCNGLINEHKSEVHVFEIAKRLCK